MNEMERGARHGGERGSRGARQAPAAAERGGLAEQGRVGPGDGGAVLRGLPAAAGRAGPGVGLAEQVWEQNAFSCGLYSRSDSL